MVNAKRLNFESIFLFFFLILFPFGQIIRIGVVQPIDVIVGLSAAYVLIKKIKRPPIFFYIESFLLVAGFSWVFGAAIFRRQEIWYGFLYLIRLAAYFYFFVYVCNFVAKDKLNKNLLLDSLLGVSAISALFGWVQYYIFPAIKPFTVWGWDDHLFRLVGTFLDPTFLGIILVFGLVASIIRIIEAKRGKNRYAFLSLFLLISLAFTYSRASYLALFAGLVAIGLGYRKFLKKALFVILAFLVLIIALPTSANHVLRFTRQFSAVARIDNYLEILDIFKTSPVFGIGYDNLCLAKSAVIGFVNFGSHSCSGSDSSLLFILATTGIAGLISFLYMLWNFGVSLKNSKYFILLISTVAALFIHSLFGNSVFYPWVMGWMAVILAVGSTG